MEHDVVRKPITLFGQGALRTRPARALKVMGSAFEQFAGKKLLQLSDSTVAASQFNWLVMADPVNRVVMLGDATIPTKQEIHRHAEAAVATFLAAFLHPDQR
ncbi:TetR/AcrR family transcriptional regulator C-terminal domain-containing protein [Rhizobium ruizarguesonis]